MSNETSGNGERGDALMRALRRLPQEIDPPHDLWPGISDGMAGGSAQARPAWRRQMWPYALAAGIGCVALGALLTFGLMRSQPAPVASGNGQEAGQPARIVEASFGGYTALGPEYERARASLAIDMAEKLGRLPPESQQKIERNLGEIRRALREINVALELEPDSVLLQQLLLSTYKHELALLANVNQMADTLPERTET